MTEIGYIAPNAYMAQHAKDIFQKYGMDVEIETGHMEQGVEKAEQLLKKGVKVLISRGGTAQCIRNKINIPVIELPITVEDIARAIDKASKFGKRVAIIGFYNLLKGLEAFNPVLNLELKQVHARDEDEIYREIVRAKAEHFDVIIGGVIQCEFADKIAMNSVFLESGPQAIYHAYQEAMTLLDTLLTERRKAEEIKAILDHTHDGFLAIDKDGNITLINPTAAKLLHIDVDDFLGKPIKRIRSDLTKLTDVLITGEEHLNEIIEMGTTVLCNSIPIIVDEKIAGAVVTFQDITVVQEAESQIRRKIYTTGLYAKYTFNDIVGVSDEIKQTVALAKKFAKTHSTILITGKSGTGKELLAQSIHNESDRRMRPFVAVNCASLPESLLESELFGYVEGAFTGARKKGKPGLFELAHGGTIFLDEISETPLALQGRLLRVLQERKVMRLGDDKVIPVDVRVIVATNRDLVDLIKQGKFREDLFFRLNVLRLNLPSLKDRSQDIPILAEKYLREYAPNMQLKLSKSAIEELMDYSWPGNVRELRNLMERIAITHESTIISEGTIKAFILENRGLGEGSATRSKPTLEEIKMALNDANNNKARAARILGVDRSTLWRWLKKMDI